MRLIDADEFCLDIKTGRIKETYYLSNTHKQMILDQIGKRKTIDAVPVKHGHWIEMTVSSGRDSWKCSLCGRRARGKTDNLPYCHCGAKMDEKIDL